jgi:hypothetical protein
MLSRERESDGDMVESEKGTCPMTMTRMENIVSAVVTPTRSPYPTVARVAHDQYIDLMIT